MKFKLLDRLLEVEGLEASQAWLLETWGFDYDLPTKHLFHLREITQPTFPPDKPQIAPLIRGEVAYLYAEPYLWLGTAEGGCRLHREGKLLEVWGSPSAHRMPLYLGIIEALRAMGWIPLHGAALAEGESATLYTARSGTGKTTTLLTGLLQGQQIVSEDMAVLNAESGMLFGLDRGLHLLSDTLERFKHALPTPTAQDPATGKWFIPFSALKHHPSPAQLRRVVQLIRDLSQPSQWTSLSVLQASLVLWEATGVPLIPESQHHTNRVLTGLVRGLEFRCLRIGNTPLFELVG